MVVVGVGGRSACYLVAFYRLVPYSELKTIHSEFPSSAHRMSQGCRETRYCCDEAYGRVGSRLGNESTQPTQYRNKSPQPHCIWSSLLSTLCFPTSKFITTHGSAAGAGFSGLGGACPVTAGAGFSGFGGFCPVAAGAGLAGLGGFCPVTAGVGFSGLGGFCPVTISMVTWTSHQHISRQGSCWVEERTYRAVVDKSNLHHGLENTILDPVRLITFLDLTVECIV